MNKLRFFRYLSYSLEILVLFILGSTPLLFPEIFNATACFLVALALSISVFEDCIPAMFFGLACGVLSDLGYSNSIGVFTITLTIVCFIIGFCANNFITVKFLNFLLISVIVITAVLSIHFLFTFIIKGYANALIYFVNHYISRIGQTIVCAVILYFVNNFVSETLHE